MDAASAGYSGNCPSEGTLTVLLRLRPWDEDAVGLSCTSAGIWEKVRGLLKRGHKGVCTFTAQQKRSKANWQLL